MDDVKIGLPKPFHFEDTNVVHLKEFTLLDDTTKASKEGRFNPQTMIRCAYVRFSGALRQGLHVFSFWGRSGVRGPNPRTEP